MDKIYEDENHNFQFDFSKAEKVVKIENLTHCIPELQYNVDFIIIEQKILFLEYKNSNINHASNKELFHEKLTINREKFCKNMAMKFVSSLFWLWACELNEKENGKEKEISYCLLIENEFMDAKMRKLFRNKISKQLPHNFEKYGEVKREILSNFAVMNFEEWKENFPQYPITAKPK